LATTTLSEGTFDPADYSRELEAAPRNLDVGTRLWFENDRIRVWEVRLEPGERGPFHSHTRRYFWTVVDGGIGRQRSADGTVITREYHVGDTNYSEHSPAEPMIHDFENAGHSPIRFVTVELLD
jgi:beta-alanine degradation protein BauB